MKRILAAILLATTLIPAPAKAQGAPSISPPQVQAEYGAEVTKRQLDALKESFSCSEDDPGFAEKVQWVVDNAADLADMAETLFTRVSDSSLDVAAKAEKMGVKYADNVAFKRALSYAEAADFVKKVGNGFNIAGKTLQFVTAEDKWRATSEICMGTLFGTLSGGNPVAEAAGEYIGGAVYDFDPVGKFIYDPLIFNRQWSQDLANWVYEKKYGENPNLQDNVYEKAKLLEKDENGRYRFKDDDAVKTEDRQNASDSQNSGTGFPPSIETFVTEELNNNQDVVDFFDDTFGEVQGWLDAVLPASTAQTVADKLEELAKQGLIKAAGAVDEAVQAQIDKLKAEIISLMPGDASKQQMAKLIDDALASGDLSTLKTAVGADLKDLGVTLAGDYAAKVVEGLNLPAAEKEALKKTVSDGVQEFVKGSGVGGVATSIKGNIENYVYDKVKQTMGQETADAWKKAYDTWQGGGNPWNDIKAAAETTIETWGFKQLEKVIDKQLTKLLDNHPVLKEVFSALGIDKNSIMGAIKNIWGVLTGGGTLMEKFKKLADLAIDGLVNMLHSLLQWGLGKLQGWLNGIFTKIGGAIKKWLQNLLANKFHLSQKIIDLVMKGVDAAVKAATKAVGGLLNKVDGVIYTVMTNTAQKAKNIYRKGGSGNGSQPPSPNAPKVDPNTIQRTTPVMPAPASPAMPK